MFNSLFHFHKLQKTTTIYNILNCQSVITLNFNVFRKAKYLFKATKWRKHLFTLKYRRV